MMTLSSNKVCSVIRASLIPLEKDLILLDKILGDVSRRQPPCLCFRPTVVSLSARCKVYPEKLLRISASRWSFVRKVSVMASMCFEFTFVATSLINLDLLNPVCVIIPWIFSREKFMWVVGMLTHSLWAL